MSGFPDNKPKTKQKREQRRFYVDARIDTSTGQPLFYPIGEDNDELTRDKEWNEDKKKNVFGNTVVSNTHSGDTISADPFYARQGDPMGILLQHFDMENAELDSIKRNYYEAKIDNEGETIYAFRQLADVLLQSVGGSSEDADNLPFNLTLSGPRVPQNFDLATETFTDKQGG